MPNQPREGLKVIHIMIEPELKERLTNMVKRLNKNDPAAMYSQSSIIRAGIELELKRLEKKLKK